MLVSILNHPELLCHGARRVAMYVFPLQIPLSLFGVPDNLFMLRV
jgi:hypothetical protein